MTRASRPSVLVVDNDEDFLRALGERLVHLQCDPVLAHNSAQALGVLGSREVAVVVTDIRMPGLDGIGLAEDIRSVSDVPIVLMTAFPEDYEGSVQHIGNARLLAKPFAWSALREILGQVQSGVRP